MLSDFKYTRQKKEKTRETNQQIRIRIGKFSTRPKHIELRGT